MDINNYWFTDDQRHIMRAAFGQGVHRQPYFQIFTPLPGDTWHYTGSQSLLAYRATMPEKIYDRN
jgi:hypothetical protein